MTQILQKSDQAQPVPVWHIQADTATDAWFVTGVGILARVADGWQTISPPADHAAMGGISALGGAGRIRWAAGAQHSLARTANGGAAWEPCWLDGVSLPITCSAASPRFETDRTVLAGTAGAGILRSTDGGRRWLLSNFGLQEFTILALATAGHWMRREVVCAGTLAGIYRSAGGGRAWKCVGAADTVIQTLAASSQFDENGLIMAGAEDGGVFRSIDHGQSWQPAAPEIGSTATINALLSTASQAGEAWLAGADAGCLWRSTDAGASWQLVYEVEAPVLALAAGPDAALYAALGEGGLLASQDGGRSWQCATVQALWRLE